MFLKMLFVNFLELNKMLDGYVFAFNQIETNLKWYTYFSRWEDYVFDFNEDKTFIVVAFFTYKPNTDFKKKRRQKKPGTS